MSYHNGSVWPHDNALIGLGFARYGFKAEAARVFEGLFNAATHQEVAALAGVVLRLHASPERCSDGLSGRLLAAGLVGGGFVSAS